MANRLEDQETVREQSEGEKVKEIKNELVQALLEAKDTIMEGILDLAHPMKSRGEEVGAIEFDFEKLTARDVLRVLDKNMGVDALRYTEQQQMGIMALACRGIAENGGLDDMDVMEQLQGEDLVAAAYIGGRYLTYVHARMNRIIREAEKGSSLLEGTLKLEKPIVRLDEAGNKTETIRELKYNFRRMRGTKYVECLGASSRTKAGISNGAGLALFAEAARSCQPIEKEELEQLHAADAIIAATVGIGFFLQSRGEVSGRIRRRQRT